MSHSITALRPYFLNLGDTAEQPKRTEWLVFLLLAIHIPLAILVRQSSFISTAHAAATFGLGIWIAVRDRNHPHRVAYVCAYIVGAEVLWRMTGASIPWEFGKYGTAALFILSMLLRRDFKPSVTALIYFALLLPSIVVTANFAHSADLLRESLSTYLSGPLALTASACFFTNVKLSKKQLQKLFGMLICPVFSIAILLILGTVTATDIQFTDESNLVTSGGFGPNQVSGALGLGALLSFLLILYGSQSIRWKSAMFGVMIILASTSAMTFSRGGLYTAVGGIVPCFFFLLNNRRLRSKVIGWSLLALVMGALVILPGLDRFSGGALSERFADVGVAHRDEILGADIELWQDNPILGVGPGMAHLHRSMSHTEYTRLLAEHGVLGLGAIIAIAIAVVLNLIKQRNSADRALTASMLGWSLTYMLDKAMRTGAPSFMFGLAFTDITEEVDTVRVAMVSGKKRASISPAKAKRRNLKGRKVQRNRLAGAAN